MALFFQEYEASPALLDTGMQNCIRNGTSMHDATTSAEAIYRTDIVAASETDCEAFSFGHKVTSAQCCQIPRLRQI